MRAQTHVYQLLLRRALGGLETRGAEDSLAALTGAALLGARSYGLGATCMEHKLFSTPQFCADMSGG